MAEGLVERVKGPDGKFVEIIVKAPIAEMKLAAAEIGQAPPSDKEVAEVAMVLAQEEHDNARAQETAAETIATVTVALAFCILLGIEVKSKPVTGLGTFNEIKIPREVVDRLTGAKLGIAETADGDVILRWRERARAKLTPEEMRNG